MNSIMDSIAGGLSVIKAPIIIPFAPRYSGKTCLLYRLIYFIRNYGFQVEFAPKMLCEETNHVASST